MAKLSFADGLLVAIKTNGIRKVGVIMSKGLMNRRRVYNIKLETGTVIPNVCVDESSDTTYIDSAATEILRNSNLKTNLTSTSAYNLRSM